MIGILASFRIAIDEQQKLIPNFWLRLEKGSWISPQILSIIDNEFETKGKAILNNCFQVKVSPMKKLEHHSAREPEGSNDASKKVLSTIQALIEHQDDDFGWRSNLIRLIENKRFKIHS